MEVRVGFMEAWHLLGQEGNYGSDVVTWEWARGRREDGTWEPPDGWRGGEGEGGEGEVEGWGWWRLAGQDGKEEGEGGRERGCRQVMIGRGEEGEGKGWRQVMTGRGEEGEEEEEEGEGRGWREVRLGLVEV